MRFVKPSQLDRTNLGTWPIYYQLLMWIIMVGLVFFLYNQFFRKDILQSQINNNNEISKLEENYRTLYQYSLDLPLYQAKKKELTDKLYSLLKFLPAETEMPNLIDETYKAAYKSDINFTEFRPEASIVKQYYDIEPISLSASTSFMNFAHFVESIGELPRILNVQRFDMEVSSQDIDVLRISGDLETYIYNQDIDKLVSGTEVGEK